MFSHTILIDKQHSGYYLDLMDISKKLIFDARDCTYVFEIETKKTFIPQCALHGIDGTCLFQSLYFIENVMINNNWLDTFENNYIEFIKKSWSAKINHVITKMERNIGLSASYFIGSLIFGVHIYPAMTGLFYLLGTYYILTRDDNTIIYTDENMLSEYTTNIKITNIYNADIQYLYIVLPPGYYLITFRDPNKKTGHAISLVVHNNKIFTFDCNFGIFEGNVIMELIAMYDKYNIIKNVKNVHITEFEYIR